MFAVPLAELCPCSRPDPTLTGTLQDVHFVSKYGIGGAIFSNVFRGTTTEEQTIPSIYRLDAVSSHRLGSTPGSFQGLGDGNPVTHRGDRSASG